MFSAKDVKELREKTGAGMLDCKKALEATEGNMEKAVDWLREKGIAKAAKKESRIAAEGLANIFTSGNKAVILEVNSETDFVSKNAEFTDMIKEIGEAVLNSEAKTLEEALLLPSSEGTIADLIVAKTSKIGEKLSLRRLEVVEKTDTQNFGAYLHMGGKIAVLTLLEGANSDVAKDVAMQAAAMRPEYLKEEDIDAERIERDRKVFTEQAINEGKPADIAAKMVEGRLKKFFKEICLLDEPFIKDGDVDVKTYVKNNGGEVLKMVRYEVGEGMEHRSDNFAEEVMNQIK